MKDEKSVPRSGTILAAVSFKSEVEAAELLRKTDRTALDNALTVFYSSRSPFRHLK